MLQTPVSQAACTLPTLPAPTSLLAPWATAQQALVVVGSRLDLVVLGLVDPVLEVRLVGLVELADVAAAVDVVVVAAADAEVEVDAVVEADEVVKVVKVVEVVEAVIKRGWIFQPNDALARRTLPPSSHCLWLIIMFCTF